jgi:transcriptional regulator with XRE-family HTH domain
MSVTSRKRLLAKLKNKAYRKAYTAEHVKTTTPLQIRTVREQREWTQGKLAAEAKTTQTAISRTEDPNYGNLTLNNLLKIAAALDVGLLVKLVPFSRLVKEYEDLSPIAMSVPSFIEELSALESWANSTHELHADDPIFHRKITVSDTLQINLNEQIQQIEVQDIPGMDKISLRIDGGYSPQDDRPLKLPARGESFELKLSWLRPLMVRAGPEDRHLLTPQRAQEVS